MANENKIVFRVGDENRIVVEPLKDTGIEDSIFSNQYHKALHVIDSYLLHRTNYDEPSNDYSSNVFAFIGERGSGKTSCMVSVSEYLKTNAVANTYPRIKGSHFISLHLIDPTFFSDEKESIVGHVMSQLLHLFKNIREEKKRSNGDYNQQQEGVIVDMFHEVASNIECLRNDKTLTPDDLEYLNQLSSAVDLKNNIRRLLKTLLELNGTPNAIIVIPIDDIDMNKNGVTKMVEDIRKYLSNEYLLIMVAVHLNQLTLIEKQEYYGQYKTLLEKSQIRPNRIDKMTEKFLDKFLPQAHRILMPDGNYYLGAPMHIVEDGKEPIKFASVRQGVCELIFSKTRYLFYNSNDTASRIIPRNLRDLRHLIGLLYNMADYDKNAARNQGNDASGLYNKTLFKEYLFGSWSRENLEEEMRHDLLNLLGITDATLFNIRVLEVLRKYFDDLGPLTKGSNAIATEILNGLTAQGNNYFNYSIGDALNVIFLLEDMTSDEPKRNLLFLLKTLYSIKLYEYYDESTGRNAVNEDEKELLLDDRVAKYNLSHYEKLAAGGFVNPSFYSLIPQEYGKHPRQCRPINILRLNKLIEECVEAWDAIPATKMNLVEYFILSISRPIDTKNKGKDTYYIEPDYRKRTEPYYAINVTGTMTSACFDVNAFLFNLARVKSCFERFPKGAELFNKIDAERDVEHPKSLWAKLKIATLRRNGSDLNLEEFKIDRWLSWVCIRNAEILQQFLNILSFSKSGARNNSVNKDLLVSYYRRFAEYSHSNYDRKNDGSFFSIDYSFTSIIADVLAQADQALFDEIYLTEPKVAIPFAELFDARRREPYNKRHVHSKIMKYGHDRGLAIPEEVINATLNGVEGDTIPVQQVKDLVNTLNARLEENGGAQENA